MPQPILTFGLYFHYFYQLLKMKTKKANTDRAVLRHIRPGHIYIKYADNYDDGIDSISSAAYQNNTRDGEKSNRYYHQRTGTVVENGETCHKIELVCVSHDDHIAGLDSNWDEKVYKYENN